MDRSRILPLLLLLMLGSVAGCDGDRPGGPPSPPLDAGRYTALGDSMRAHAQRRDTVFCDSVLGYFEDERVVSEQPKLVARAYMSSVMVRRKVSPALVQRIDGLARRTKSGYIANWRDLLRGRMAMNQQGVMDSAVAIFTMVYPRFKAMADTQGVSMTAKQLGFIYKETLGQPDLAIPYLREYFATAPDVNEQYNAAVHLCGAFLLDKQLDSSAYYLHFMEVHLPELEKAAPGYPADKGDRRDLLRFLLTAERAKGKDRVAMDSLRAWFGPLIASQEAVYKQMRWNPVKVRVSYAEALMANGDKAEALRVLKEGIPVAEACDACVYANTDLYDILSTLAGEVGDPASALAYLRSKNAWRDKYNKDLRNSEVEKVRRSMQFTHERDSTALEMHDEEARSRLAIAEGRWQRNALLGVALLVLVVAAWSLNRARLKRTIAVERMRARLSRDLHDDIGSTLSSIHILSNVAQRRMEHAGDADAAASLAKISDRSQRLLRNMSDIVWSVDPQKDTLEELVARMREFATSVLEAKGIALTFDVPAQIPVLNMAPEVKNGLYLLFKEALNNAVKHAQASRIGVHFGFGKQALRLEVRDDGIGLAANTAAGATSGNGLRNMRSRAAEMKADLHVESVPGKGTAIVLTLPL